MKPKPKGMRRRARRGWRTLLRVARFVLLGAGWITFAGAATLVALERTGTLNGWIEGALAAALGSAGDDLQVRSTTLIWSSRTVVLSGVRLGERGRDLSLERLAVQVGWSAEDGLRVDRITLDRGMVRISPNLISILESVVERQTEDRDLLGRKYVPNLAVNDLEIRVEPPRGADFSVGVLNLVLRKNRDGRLALSGRLKQTLDDGSEPGVVFLEGFLNDENLLEVHAMATDLPMREEYLVEGTALEELRVLEPQARLTLDAEARYHWGHDILPTVTATVHLKNGSISLPWWEAAEEQVEDIELSIFAAYDPDQSVSLFDRAAWSAEAAASASWGDVSGEAFARMGQAATSDTAVEAWMHVKDMRVDADTVELLGRPGWLADLWEMIAPNGRSEMLLGLRLPNTWRADDRAPGDFIDVLQQVFMVLPAGNAEVTYVGGPNESHGGQRDLGFPLTLRNVEGLATYMFDAQRTYPEEFGLYDLRANHGSGQVQLTGAGFYLPRYLAQPGMAKEDLPYRFHLVAQTDHLAVDDTLRDAVAGLAGVEGLETLWTDYAPSGGNIGFRAEFWSGHQFPGLAVDLGLDFHDVGFRWADYPFPVKLSDGRLTMESDGMGLPGMAVLAIDGVGTSEVSRGPVQLAGHLVWGPQDAESMRWEIAMDRVNLASSKLREVLNLTDPEVLESLGEAGVKGLVDVSLSAAQTSIVEPDFIWLEIHTTEGMQMLPKVFPVFTTDLHGRLLARMEYAPGAGDDAEALTDVRAAVLGVWGAGPTRVPVWATGHFPVTGSPTLTAIGAGVDVTSNTVIGALEVAMTEPGEEPVDIDLVMFDLEGYLDFRTDMTLSEEFDDEVISSTVGIQARLDRCGMIDVIMLTDFQGHLSYTFDEVAEGEVEDDEWYAETITANLGNTQLTFNDLHFRAGPEGTRLDTQLTVDDLPIDREHLVYLLDEQSLTTLLVDLECRGQFDVSQGQFSVRYSPRSETQVTFDGRLQLNDMFIRLGLPVTIKSAEDVDLQIKYDGNYVRARARVGRFFGQVAGRRLDNASMQLTYIEPRLTLEAFDGEFEGGRLRSLGHAASSGAGFFSIDLESPFPFSLAAEVENVDVGRLLRGMFNSDFANEGRLDGKFRLDGEVDQLLKVRGSGEFEIKDSSLWAIPALQALFSRLGFDSAAIFSRMESRYNIENGVVHMTRMRIKSDLLSLVGEGSVDFDGTLHHDMEVRYSLVDRLGPFTRLLYFIQNSLLRIGIRGDMSRPEIVVKGILSGFFGSSELGQRLPLPAYGELPVRY